MEFSLPGTGLVLHAEGPPSGTDPLINDGTVRLTAGARADLFLDPSGVGARPDAERYMTTVAGNFVFGGHVAADLRAPYDSGVLLAMIDERSWFKVCAELDPHGIPRVVSVVTREGRSDDANAWEIPASGTYLRIARRGETAALHASRGDGHWDLVRYFHPGFDAPTVSIGILAQSPAGEGTEARFSSMFFRHQTLDDLRDGH